MKKILTFITILAVFIFAVFCIGWTQIRVPADKIGIVVSKTGGINPNPVIPGKFSWHKEFLLPTNALLKKFQIKPVNTTKTISGELASGGIYSNIYHSQDNFSYHFTFSISVSLSPEAVVELYSLNKILSDEDLDLYLNGACDSVAQLAANYLMQRSFENPSFRPESVRREDLIRNIQPYKEFPELEISVLALTDSKIPDYALYTVFQTQYKNVQELNSLANTTNSEEEDE